MNEKDTRPATEKQIAYIMRLMAEKRDRHAELYRADVSNQDIGRSTRTHHFLAHMQMPDSMSLEQASQAIDILQSDWTSWQSKFGTSWAGVERLMALGFTAPEMPGNMNEKLAPAPAADAAPAAPAAPDADPAPTNPDTIPAADTEAVAVPADVEPEPQQPTLVEMRDAVVSRGFSARRYYDEERLDIELSGPLPNIITVEVVDGQWLVNGEAAASAQQAFEYVLEILSDASTDTDADTAPDPDPADEALDRLIDEVSAAEEAAFNAAQALLIEAQLAEEARLDEMLPLSHFASLAKPATLRRAALEGRLVAEKIGRDWFTTERAVRRYIAAHPPRHQRLLVRPGLYIRTLRGQGLLIEIEERSWDGDCSVFAVDFIPSDPIAWVEREYGTKSFDFVRKETVVDDPRVRVVLVTRGYEFYGWRVEHFYFIHVHQEAPDILRVIDEAGKIKPVETTPLV